MSRSKFTDEERIDMVILGLRDKPVEEICSKLQCPPYSIYQARRSDWYQLLEKALRPYVTVPQTGPETLKALQISEAPTPT